MSEPVVQGAVLQEGQMRCYCRCMPSMHSSEVLLAAQIRLRAQGLPGYCRGAMGQVYETCPIAPLPIVKESDMGSKSCTITDQLPLLVN